MTAQSEFERSLNAWLDNEGAAPPPPQSLARTLEATSRLRPRPPLTAGLGSHWIGSRPVATTSSSLAALRPVLTIALIALLAIALVGGAVVVGSRLLDLPRVTNEQSLRIRLVSAAGLSRPMVRPVLAQLSDGRVLVMGGGADAQDATPSAELYDPGTGGSVAVGPMLSVPWVAWAVPLKDGRVLIVGGEGQAQLFDPDASRFSSVGGMVMPRRDTVGALLDDGRVLVVGGGLREAELFDPDTLTFSETGAMAATPAENAALAILPDGRAWALARVQSQPDVWAIEAEIYDPLTGSFATAGRMPDYDVAAAIGMPDGRLLVIGSSGMSGQNFGRAMEWDPTTRAFSPAVNPPGRVSKATLLNDGTLLLLGFVQFPRDPATCAVRTEHACSWAGIYDMATGATSSITPPTAWQPSITRLTDGRVLVVGGLVNGEVGPPPAANEAPAVATVQIYQ